ncbi:MAG: murF [Bacilli bacterium]|nr:murF [Bacilli bacterium]
MIKETARTIALWVEGTVIGDLDCKIEGVSIDSRTVSKSQLYIPIIGAKNDGHLYADEHELVKRGVEVMLWQKDHPMPVHMPKSLVIVDNTLTALQQLAKSYRAALACKVVGVTGSNGKTSTKDLVAAVLSSKFKVQKTQGNYNTEYGLPLTLLQLDHDTEIVVLEMGMRGRGEIDLLAKLSAPDYGVITNIGEAHLERLGSRAAIAEAKFELISRLPAAGHAFLNGDEPLLRKLSDRSPAQVTWFGLRQNFNDLYPSSLSSQGLSGTAFTLPDSDTRFFLPIPGDHQVANAIAAIAIARHLGCSDQECARALSTAQLTAMRLEVLPGLHGGFVINDAFNASPTSTKAALLTLSSLRAEGLLVAVLGDMLELGENSANYHYEVGEFAAKAGIDLLVAVGSFREHLIKGAQAQGMATGWVHGFAATDDAAEWLEDFLARSADPTILVKGSRGMAMERIVNRLVAKD